MPVHKIVYLPHAALRQIAKPVEHFDDYLAKLIDDLFATMYAAKGVGLAAPQVGISLRLAVIDVKGDQTEQFTLINPEIIAVAGEAKYQEGCLSVPGAYDTVVRAARVSIKALDRFGKPFNLTADGLLGECIQHEIDHLNGKLFIDLLSPLKRAIARRKLAKLQREYAKKFVR